MKLFLTGGTGLLGRYFAELATGAGAQLVSLVRPFSNAAHLRELRATLHTGDLSDVAVLAAGMQGCKAVVHLAGPKGGWRRAGIYERQVVQGTGNVLDAMRASGVFTLIYLSSICVHGLDPIQGTAVNEVSGFGHHFCPYDYYGLAKIEAEKQVAAAHQAGHIRATVLRPGWFYGPHDGDSYGRLATRLRQRLLFKIGTGDNRLPLVYVGNVADIIWRCLGQPSDDYRVYLYAADGPVTQNDYLASLARAARINKRPITLSLSLMLRLAGWQERLSLYAGYRLPTLHTRQFVYLWGSDWSFDQRRIAQELDYRPGVDYTTGFAAAERWYQGGECP